jgi:3',5'-cyclic AMP phosphodiesterase CpdA
VTGVRLAHVSDLHTYSLAGATPLAFLGKRFAGLVNLQLHRKAAHPGALLDALVEDLNRVRPDEIAVSGDLTSLSLTSEFRAARALLDRIERGARHVTVVPGNHDVYTLDALLRRPFHHHLLPYATSDSGDDAFPFVRVRDPIALVGCSTARPSPVPFASGALGGRQLERLEERLHELGRRGLFRVVVMHHPPVANRTAVLRGLPDRDAFARVVERVGCELVLHGHEHRDLEAQLRGPAGLVPVSCVGSASYDDPRVDRRARYHVYELAPSLHGAARIVGREVRVHDPVAGRFVSAAEWGAQSAAGADSKDQPSAPHTALRG